MCADAGLPPELEADFARRLADAFDSTALFVSSYVQPAMFVHDDTAAGDLHGASLT